MYWVLKNNYDVPIKIAWLLIGYASGRMGNWFSLFCRNMVPVAGKENIGNLIFWMLVSTQLIQFQSIGVARKRW